MSTVVSETPSVEIAQLARDLRALGGDVSRGVNKQYKSAVGVVAADARRRASWSTTIPAALKVKTASSKVHPGADIVVSGVPHHRLYEGLTSGGRKTFRHKVFDKPPKRAIWVSQQTRPYIRPAAWAGREALKTAVDKAVIEAARDQGWT